MSENITPGMPGIIKTVTEHFDRKIAASNRDTLELRDGIYERRERPSKGSGATILVDAGHKEDDKVWVRVKRFEDLGYANGWSASPAIVSECQRLNHGQTSSTEGRCIRRITCAKCGYFYLIDSGD